MASQDDYQRAGNTETKTLMIPQQHVTHSTDGQQTLALISRSATHKMLTSIPTGDNACKRFCYARYYSDFGDCDGLLYLHVVPRGNHHGKQRILPKQGEQSHIR